MVFAISQGEEPGGMDQPKVELIATSDTRLQARRSIPHTGKLEAKEEDMESPESQAKTAEEGSPECPAWEEDMESPESQAETAEEESPEA
jgi:hypothetical protein